MFANYVEMKIYQNERRNFGSLDSYFPPTVFHDSITSVKKSTGEVLLQRRVEFVRILKLQKYFECSYD